MNRALQIFLLFFGFMSLAGCVSGSGNPDTSPDAKPQEPNATLLVYDGFEDPGANWGRQTAKPENLQTAQPAIARAGKQALRVRVHRDDQWVAGGPRSELLQPRDLGYWEEGQEYWIGASVLFPADYQDDPMQEIFWQVHGSSKNDQNQGRQGGRQRNRDGGKSQASVPFIMQSVGDSILIKGKGIQSATIQKTKGEWMDFAVHHLFSSNGKGITQVYVNGNLVINGQNISNLRPGDRLYQKFGIYKSGWKRGFETQSTVLDREIWFDEIRIGGSDSGLAAVSPAADRKTGS